LKKIYGEHACLTMAKVEEHSCWSGWNSGQEEVSLDRDNSDEGTREISGNDHELPTKTTFCKTIKLPQVTHIEQAERLAVHSCLNHSSPSKTNNDASNKSTDSNEHDKSNNDYSQLPTPQENNAICFWMTNVLELLDIPERHLDRKCTCAADNCQCQLQRLRPGRGKFHGDMNPYRPLQLPDLDVVRDVWKDIGNKSVQKNNAVEDCQKEENGFLSNSITTNTSDNSKPSPSYKEEKVEDMQQKVEGDEGDKSAATKTTIPKPQSAWEKIVASANVGNEAIENKNETSSDTPLEQMQLALSFRADLPLDVPPTMSAECVKYFYSAVLVVTTVEGELLVTQCPFSVLTSTSQHSSREKSHQTSTTRVRIGDLHAIAHSASLPTYLSSTEVSDATPSQLMVVANPPACDIVSRRTAEQRTSTHRIEDKKGCFCGLMTLVGIGGPLVPGTRLGIRVRFPIYDDDENGNGAGIIPCHRVCCALVGEEYVICEEGKKRVKTRSYVFDSAHEMVEFGYTEAISMSLVLPLDCPVTVKTDLVEVTVMLKVEFIVSRTSITNQRSVEGVEDKDQGEFSVIRLDLPCEVVHGDGGSSGYPEDGEEERHVSSIRTMQKFWVNSSNSDEDGDGFDDTDIQSDLRMLSMRMIDIGEMQT